MNDDQHARETANAVERSLEDFILKANTSLPPPGPATAPVVRGMSAAPRRRRTRPGRSAPGTLVVLGPQAPLAEETEIVSRLPADELRPARRSWSSARMVLAFLAGAAIVLVVTRLISGGPHPVKPVPVSRPTVTATPPIVVQPLPVAAPLPVPLPVPVSEPAAPAPGPEATSTTVKQPKPVVRRAAKARRAPAAEPRKSGGLVDPFAN